CHARLFVLQPREQFLFFHQYSLFLVQNGGFPYVPFPFWPKHRREFDLIYLLFPIFLNPCGWFPLLRRIFYLFVLHEHFCVLSIFFLGLSATGISTNFL